MGAPRSAIPLSQYGDSGKPVPNWGFHCEGCEYKGKAGELLTEPDGDNQTLWCPVCEAAAWVWD